ncbi:MAG: glucokinase [Legionella sp.]|nr:glucokinase [Legionella sp.]
MSSQPFAVENHAFAIAADIGGTNARFSRVDLMDFSIDEVEIYPCSDFPNITDAFSYYQRQKGLTTIKHAAIAIACPVISDAVNMTNCHWQFSIRDVKGQLGLDNLQIINDFTAQAMSLLALRANEKIRIGSGVVDESSPMAVLGAGTGLGVAHLIPTASGVISLPGEGGHTDWAAHNEQEWFIHRFLCRKFGRVSTERLLSGSGLENLYLAIAAFNNQQVATKNAAEIANLALNEQCSIASAAVAQFFASLGSYAGDLALTFSAFGGVYITGGVVPKLLPLMANSDFRKRFEEKGRLSAFNRQIATYVVSAPQPGLLGAAVYLKQKMASIDYGFC